jgi:hypothetical protein
VMMYAFRSLGPVAVICTPSVSVWLGSTPY